jgi:hypothetical protein
MTDLMAAASAALFSDPRFTTYEQLEQDIDNSDLFHIAVQKSNELERKRERFATQPTFNAYLLCDPPNLALGSLHHPRVSKTTKIHTSNAEEIYSVLSAEQTPSLVLLTNNVLAKIGLSGFILLREKTLHCLYVIQDYDCHHWYRMSVQCALLSDVYVPGHPTTPPFVKLICSHRLQTVPIGSIQWEKDFLLDNLPLILSTDRPVQIAGKHSLYARFPYRNRLIATFGTHFPNVGFTDTHHFHQWTQAEKLKDWTQSMFHFVAPVSCDIPIRVYDALVTGGMPVVPKAMAQSLHAVGITAAWYEDYGAKELFNPIDAYNIWTRRCKALTDLDHYERVLQAIKTFHIDAILSQISDVAFSELTQRKRKGNHRSIYP